MGARNPFASPGAHPPSPTLPHMGGGRRVPRALPSAPGIAPFAPARRRRGALAAPTTRLASSLAGWAGKQKTIRWIVFPAQGWQGECRRLPT